MLVVPPCLRQMSQAGCCHRGKSQTWGAKGCAGGKGSPPSCSQPSLCSCKSSKLASAEQSALFLLQCCPFPHSPPASASPLLHSLRSGKFIFACGAEKPWTVSACIYVQMGLFVQLCSRKLWWLPFSWAQAPQGGSHKVLVHPWNRGWGRKRSYWVYSPSWEHGKEWNSISNHLF